MALTKISRGLLSTGVSDSSDATAITITSDEKVGIGTTTPSYMLTVKSSSNNHFRMENGSELGVLFLDSDGDMSLWAHGDENIKFLNGTGSGTERMRIDSSGNVGIGTTSPGEKFAVNGDGSYIEITHPTASSYSGMKFSEGGVPQGSLQNIGSTFSTVARRGNFEIFHNTGGNLTLQHGGGNVGIGTSSPDYKLVTRDATTSNYISVIGATNGNAGITFGDDDEKLDAGILYKNDTKALRFFQGGFTEAMTLASTGNLGIGDTSPAYRLELPNTASAAGQGRANNWVTYSDSRIKSNIQVLNYGLDIVKQLKPSKYKHHNSTKDEDGQFLKLDEGANDIGFIAQEVLPLMPEVVGIPEDTDKDLYSINYPKLTAVLTKAIQELSTKLEAAEARITTLEG